MSGDSYRLLKFTCKDKMCGGVIAITSLETVIECLDCGQRFDQNALQDAELITEHDDTEWATVQFVRRMLFTNLLPKRGTELVKVHGLSNYYCKLLSPLLTRYGMDKSTGRAKLLTEMNQGDIFDCSLFGDRAFLIEPMHIPIAGFGRDVTGSINYLSETLKIITASNEGEERLVPIYTDGDGHCLVHAISRALVGRELFWHPLRCCLKRHFERNLSKYQQLFKDFMQPEDWQAIIEESDPDFKPPEGELHGLRNMHIFGLANVLKRPIILLDSLECMKKCGDYSALFLPGFILPEECRGKDNTLNKPICIAWSSFSHNHYIPLVGVQKRPLPVLPQALIPKVWGMPQSQVELYIESDSNGNCIIGGSRVLTENYIQRLVNAMDVLFLEKNGVHPMLVADAKLYLCSDTAFLNIKVETVIERTRAAAIDGRLYRCPICKALSELQIDSSWFRAGGLIYNALLQTYEKFNTDTSYKVPINGLSCKYDPSKNEFVPDLSTTGLDKCNYCGSSSVRRVKANGSIIYLPDDEEFHNTDVSTSSQQINHLANKPTDLGTEESIADAHSDLLVIKIVWNGHVAQDSILWPDFLELGGNSMQDSVSHLASNFAAKHFQNEASNVKFHMYVCDEIWNQVSQHVSIEKTNQTESSQPIEEVKTEIENEVNTELENKVLSVESSSSTPEPPVAEPQYVKVVSSKGQQGNIILNKEGISYPQLQEWISKEFKIPAQNQIIKSGFPPKELEVPCDITNYTLPLKHGDRLMVETGSSSYSEKKNYLNSSAHNRTSDIQDTFTEDLQHNQTSHDLLWRVSVFKPEVFKKGGYIFNKAAEKHILCDMTHVTISYLPTKRFCFSAASNSLELCVKPIGHFQISGDIDSRIEAAKRGESVTGFSKCPQISGPPKESFVTRPFRKPITSSDDSYPLVRKGPGFSILTSPKPSDKMDFS